MPGTLPPTRERDELIPLLALRPGESGRIDQVLGHGEFVARLREIGMCAGVDCQMIRPGSPCLIRLRGQKLCVRGEEVARVLVRPRLAAS